MDKYIVAPPLGSTQNSVGAADGKWQEGYFEKLPNWQEYLAESTGYGIVSGCAPSISGLTVTVAAGVVHLADGTRKEISATTVTLDAADSTNPRIDLVYITSSGVVAKVTGTAAASPSAPALPANGISVAQVSVAANATTGTVTDSRGMLARWYNTGIVNVKDFGAVGDGVTDDTAAFKAAFSTVESRIYIPKGVYKITDYVLGNNDVICDGTFSDMTPLFSTPRRVKSIKQISRVHDFITGYGGVAYGEAMTYNSNTGKILIALYKYTSPEGTILLTMDKNTYEIEDRTEISGVYPVNGLAYDENNNEIYMCANQVFKVNANDFTDYEQVYLPDNRQRICFDEKTKTSAMVSYNSVIKGYDVTICDYSMNNVLKRISFYDIEDSAAFQDCEYDNGKVYTVSFEHLWELDVCKGTAYGIGIEGGVEIEGISRIEDELYVSCHQQGEKIGFESIYKVLENTTPQVFDELYENPVRFAADVNLNAFIGTAEYIVSSADTTNKNYPENETSGVLKVTSNNRMSINNIISLQEFTSLVAPYNRYCRCWHRSTNTWTDWKRQLALPTSTVINMDTSSISENNITWQTLPLPNDNDYFVVVEADFGTGESARAIRNHMVIDNNAVVADSVFCPEGSWDTRTAGLTVVKPKNINMNIYFLNVKNISVKLLVVENDL